MTITLSLWWLLLLIPIGIDMLDRLWILFLATMKLQDVRDDKVLETLSPFMQWVAKSVYLRGAAFNFLARHTVACVVFRVGWKRGEYGISPLVERLRKGPPGWQQERAQWWTTNVLGPFDRSGRHSNKEGEP